MASVLCFFWGMFLVFSCFAASHEQSTGKYESWRMIQQRIKKEAMASEAKRLQDNPCEPVSKPAGTLEVASLKTLYELTGGPNWLNNENWLVGDPCTNGWFGVCCSDDGHVVEIRLPSNQLVGELPHTIESFSALNALQMSGNYLSGLLPSDLFLSPNTLEIIDFEHNQLQGALPNKLEMPVLKNLSLSNNQFGGLLPNTWNVPKLQVLSLSSNRFEGPLPTSLQTLTNLQFLDLSSNFFSGSLPSEYGNLVLLEKLWLFENQFDNPEIPASWLKMRAMENFQMNGLSGTIPKSLGESWPNLEVLILVNGNLVGNIPTSVCQLKKLQYLHIFYNNISGSIPECVCTNAASPLISIDLSNNLLSGNIPDCFQYLTDLHFVYLSNNHLSGSLPSSLGAVKTLYSLDLSTNLLSGAIPSSFSSLKSSLNQLDLSMNYLSSIDNGLEPLFDELSRRSCNIYGNPFSCPIPDNTKSCGNPRCSTCNTGRNHTSCSICVKTDFCGWCDEIPNCLGGYSEGPYYPYTCKTSEWYYGKNATC